jgi:hypothetical protein
MMAHTTDGYGISVIEDPKSGRMKALQIAPATAEFSVQVTASLS